jgi:hypothetical protein
MKLLLSLSLLLVSSMVLAQDIYSQGSSPWCLVRDEIEVCNYSTQEICYNVAIGAGGYCRENARRAGVKGDGEWCVISANGRNCRYFSQQACLNAARSIDSSGISSGCVYNTELALEKAKERNESFGFALEDQIEASGQDNLANQLREAQSQQEEAAAPSPGESQ